MSPAPQRFSGVSTALVTPFTATGEVDLDAYKWLINAQIEDGVSGLVAIGTTGEASTLSDDEKIQVVKTCVDEAAGRVFVIAGAGANSTRAAVTWQKRMQDLGVDGTLQVTPWYNKPNQEGLYQHFAAIAEAATCDVVLYNVPSRCGVDLLPETALKLARDFPRIVAIKEATGSIQRSQEILARLADFRPDFTVLSGEDGIVLPLAAIGGHGVISVSSHLAAREMVAMLAAFEAGKHDEAAAISARLSLLIAEMFSDTNPLPVKTALALSGLLDDAHFRLPLAPLPTERRNRLRARLIEIGFLSEVQS
jgi:4-hydroxy-tetrahydrodipicolinate synthase